VPPPPSQTKDRVPAHEPCTLPLSLSVSLVMRIVFAEKHRFVGCGVSAKQVVRVVLGGSPRWTPLGALGPPPALSLSLTAW